MHRIKSIAFPLMLFVGVAVLQADTIGGPDSDCASCAGAAYTLTYSGSPISSTSTTQTFQITLDVNDAFYSGGGSFLNAVAINVAAPADLVGASLASAPSDFSSLSGSGLDASGCASNGSGFVCTQADDLGAPVSGSPYDFVFDVTVDTGTLFTGTDAASIKGLYVNSDGRKVGALLSEDITLQTASAPEPSSALMLGSVLFGALLLFRRTRKAQA